MTIGTLSEAKAKARVLRKSLAAQGKDVGHAQALELVAQMNGVRDWNTFHALLSRNEGKTFQLNEKVTGQYLGQAFKGRIVSLEQVGKFMRLGLRLDEPVNPVRFEGFSSMRHHIKGTVGPDGRSVHVTSDGTPHLVIDL